MQSIVQKNILCYHNDNILYLVINIKEGVKMKNICYEICDVCNLKCDYCISSDNHNLEKEDYLKINEFIKRLSPERIVIGGGEPFLDPELLTKLKQLRESLPNSFISLSSNGTAYYPLKELQDYVDCIDISFPSLNHEIYKKMRGQDKVEEVINSISRVAESGFYSRVSCMLTSQNLEAVPELLHYLESFSIDEVRLGRFFPFREARKLNEKYKLTDIELANFMKTLSITDYSFKIVPPISSLDLMEKGYLVVNCAGEVFLPTREGRNLLGTVHDLDLIDTLTLEEQQEKIFVGMSTKENTTSRMKKIGEKS